MPLGPPNWIPWVPLGAPAGCESPGRCGFRGGRGRVAGRVQQEPGVSERAAVQRFQPVLRDHATNQLRCDGWTFSCCWSRTRLRTYVQRYLTTGAINGWSGRTLGGRCARKIHYSSV